MTLVRFNNLHGADIYINPDRVEWVGKAQNPTRTGFIAVFLTSNPENPVYVRGSVLDVVKKLAKEIK